MNKNKIAIALIVVLAATFYSLTLRGASGNPDVSMFKDNLDQATKAFELSPERGRYAHVLALGERETYALNREIADEVYSDVGYYNGKFFAFFAPGISYMALPFYLLGKHYNLAQVGTFSFISLMSILALLFLFKIAREIIRLPLWASLLSVVIFAFGSTAWSYAITLYQHHLTVLFIVSSFYAVWRYKAVTPWSWLWGAYVWLAYGLAIFIDYPNVLLMLPIIIYFLVVSLHTEERQKKVTFSLRGAFLATALLFVIISGLHLYHNDYYFGSWKQLSGGLPKYKVINEAALLEKLPASQELLQISETQNVVGYFKEKFIPFSFYTLTVSPDRGLFFYAPIFLLSLFGVFAIRKKITLEFATLLGVVGVNVLLYSSWGDPWGGWAYGPRYLIPSMAVLSLFIGGWVSINKSPAINIVKKILAYILFLYSSGIALLGAITTNAIPPKVEADYFHLKYNFLRNYDYFSRGESGSFIYNTYLSGSLTLQEYFVILYIALALIAGIILFVLPKLKYLNYES